MIEKKYDNPKEAYEFLNQWTAIKTNYETQFFGKKVTEINVLLKDNQPRFATVHYKTDTHVGSETIDLSNKILLNAPDKTVLDFKVLDQK